MLLLDVHPWLRFATGLITGCWIGVAIGCAMVMLLAGRRLRQLEAANLLLRVKLRARERARRTGAGAPGPILVANPATGTTRPAGGGRFASGGR